MGAVISVSLRTMKRLQPLPSATFPVVFEHDRLVGALLLGLVLRQRGVDVGADELAPARDRVVGDPEPGGDERALAPIELEVVAHREHVDRELVAQTPEARRQLDAGLVDERSDVDVTLRRVPLHQRHDRARERFAVEGQLGAKESPGVEESLGVVGEPEDVDRSPVVVEVAADPGEGSGPVLHGVGADADLRVGERDDAALEERVFHHRVVHATPPSCSIVGGLLHGPPWPPIATGGIGTSGCGQASAP